MFWVETMSKIVFFANLSCFFLFTLTPTIFRLSNSSLVLSLLLLQQQSIYCNYLQLPYRLQMIRTRLSFHSLSFGYLPKPAHTKLYETSCQDHSQKMLKRLLSLQDGG